ncbi:Asp-tRNA(Asn)/Glu-tRNA(Gln) amidotransferase subunit GatA [Paenibacillus fonticola]|uniref:Asp-tRNA(Asn)/Glu-tRNA(Gln) amidotransferase subunit GatA n=1 Tax=Paenibacillus fonticola TaxID=379896 RepID=UPI00035FCA5E|nr:Asp-tRNA(Asn)/Glu-tRNA(Gln) amidotransferase subunit GatA [Paenibacillus fonticola]
MTLFDLRLKDLHNQLRNKEISVTDVVNEAFAKIGERDEKIGAYLTLNEEGARAEAARLDDKLASGEDLGLLFGLPVGVKDNMVTEGIRTTCASHFLSNYDPIYNGTVISKLKQADSILIGKLNMDEFAMGGSNESSHFHPVRNPWDFTRVPGGSSGGSAAAVAAGEAYFTLGSDTGGSIRQPASYCGVVGLKPTYGLVSRYGVVAFASSLDQIGPITKNVEDAAHVLQAIAGYDPKDSTSAKVDVPNYASALTGDIAGLRIAVPKEYLEGIDPQVKASVMEALRLLESLGAVWEEVSLPHTEYAVAAYYLLSSSEASSNLSRFDGIRYGVRAEQTGGLLDLYHESRSQGFGPEVKRRIMLGTYALSSGYYDAYYLKALKVRTLIKRDFDQTFEKYDAIVGPTTPTTAFSMGSQVDDPLTMYLNDILTIPVSLAGMPAISVPCGFSQGLPIGLQFIGKAFDESTILRLAHAFEANSDHHKQRPSL